MGWGEWGFPSEDCKGAMAGEAVYCEAQSHKGDNDMIRPVGVGLDGHLFAEYVLDSPNGAFSLSISFTIPNGDLIMSDTRAIT